MKGKRPARRADRQFQLLDAQMESYMNWRAQTRFVTESYRKWRRAPTHQRAVAFERYVAALDREELAAGDYRRATELVHHT